MKQLTNTLKWKVELFVFQCELIKEKDECLSLKFYNKDGTSCIKRRNEG